MTTTDAPLISVIIPHLNQPDHLRRCLASLAAGRLPPDEVIVVDNGSRVLPVEVCNDFPGTRLLSEAKPGPGPARNTGVAASKGGILAFIDADCLADPLWLWTAQQAMSAPGAEILGGDVRIAYADANRLTTLECYESIYAYRMDRYIAREGFTGTGNLVISRAVFAKVGPFAGLDVAEDRDWGQRATRAGHRIRFVAAMRVYHPARQTFRDLAVKWERATAHDFVKAGSRDRGRLRFVLKTLAMPLSPFAEIPGLLVSDRLAGLGNKARAFLCLLRIRLHRTRIMVRLLAGIEPATYSGAWNRPAG